MQQNILVELPPRDAAPMTYHYQMDEAGFTSSKPVQTAPETVHQVARALNVA
jgi:hypothetical protein